MRFWHALTVAAACSATALSSATDRLDARRPPGDSAGLASAAPFAIAEHPRYATPGVLVLNCQPRPLLPDEQPGEQLPQPGSGAVCGSVAPAASVPVGQEPWLLDADPRMTAALPGSYDPAAADFDAACPGGLPLSACCHDGASWFAGVSGLVMTRDRGSKLYTTSEVGNPANQILDTQQADVGWGGGWQVNLGRRLPCDDCGAHRGLEFIYWQLETLVGTASARSEQDLLGTPLDLQSVTIGGNPAASWFENAREHRLHRENQIYSFELNLLSAPLVGDPSRRLRATWLVGLRYFHFDESLVFGSASGGNEFGSNGGANEAYLVADVRNQLWGAQIGGRADCWLGPRLSLFAAPKIGLYGNHVEHRAQLYSGDNLSGFDIASSKTDVAVLAELDLGGRWNFAGRWSAFGGYRLVAVSGVALSDSQVPPLVASSSAWEDVDSGGSLLVHGALAGLECRF